MNDQVPLPLSRYPLFRSQDLDEARERVAAVFCPHRLDRVGNGRFLARQHHLPGQRLSLNYIEYGAKTLISPGELEGFYLIQIPLQGSAAIVHGSERYFSNPNAAAVLNPHLPTTMLWDEGCRQVLVRICREALQSHLATHMGMTTREAVTFRGALDITRGSGATLRRLILHLISEAEHEEAPIGSGGLLAHQLEDAVLTGLLEAHRHNFRCHLSRASVGHETPIPRHVRLAEEYLLAHLGQNHTLEEIAQAVGVSTRALQMGFRQFRNSTPMQFLRNARLARVHEELLRAEQGSMVTDIAMRWGFTHFGRFSASYRQRFGCTPSQTLRGTHHFSD